MNITPVTHLSREIAKVVFQEHVILPIPTLPVPFTASEPLVGKYAIANETNVVLDISLKKDDLYLTVPKMYGVIYKFKLVPVSHNAVKTTFLTEMIHEQLVFYYSPSGEIERLEYTDFHGKKHVLYKGMGGS